MAVYQWKDVARLNLDAQVAGERIEELTKQHGGVTPKILLDDARSETSPLHCAFEWNNDIAAEKYRENQARYILRSIVVNVVEKEGGAETKVIRAFVNVGTEEKRVYTTVQEAMSNDSMREQVIERALKDLKDWERRYQDLVEFSKVIDAIKEKEAELELAVA